MTERERDVRAAVYGAFRDTGKAPAAGDLAVTLGLSGDDILDALRGLAAAHGLVLRPDGASIWMAHPFSGIPTDFLVTVGARRWFANCVWDGLAIIGIPIVAVLRLVAGSHFFEGQTTTLVSVLFLGGVQLISLGILGEYVGRLYDEAKGRPLYIVREAPDVDE